MDEIDLFFALNDINDEFILEASLEYCNTEKSDRRISAKWKPCMIIICTACIFLYLAVRLTEHAGGGNGAKLHVYEYSEDGSGVLNYTGDVYDDYPKANYYTDDAAVPTISFDFNGTQYELTYYETGQKELVPYEEESYRNSDGVKISFKKGTRQVCGIQSEDGLRISDLEKPKTEEDFQQISDSFVKDYIAAENYTCSLTTEVAYFLQEGEKASRWYEKKDFFYTSSSETEAVQYIFTYRRYLNDFRTNDMAKVVLNSDGTLDRLVLSNIGAFEEAEKQLVQKNALQSAVSEKITAICPEGYQVENIQNDIMICIDEAGKLFFFVEAKPILRAVSNNEQLEGTCYFIIAKE